ncbi:hypothetical protein [Moraxella sp. VT-16-12]|nr:hypothetical protein [Moraxella sp. VT-16-12]
MNLPQVNAVLVNKLSAKRNLNLPKPPQKTAIIGGFYENKRLLADGYALS